MNHTIEKHIEARRLEPRPARDQEVLGFWTKAVTALGDAMNPGSSLDNRLIRAYDAGRIAAFGLVRDAGYRTRGGEGHHYVTFDVARSVVTDPDLRRVLAEMDGLRKVRHSVEYEAHDDVDEPTVKEACRLAKQIIELGTKHLRERRPALDIPMLSR